VAALALGSSVRGDEPARPSIHGVVRVLDRRGRPKDSQTGVVVFLDELENAPPSWPAPRDEPVIRQADKRFVPELLPILVGTTVNFLNDDTIYHNVFSLSRTKPFDLGIYEQGASRRVRFDRPGLVRIYCNIHSQMAADVLVLSNPYFVVTGQDGRFRIPDVPVGSATLRTWDSHSREPPELKIRVGERGVTDANGNSIVDIAVEIREDAVSIDHLNKWGQPYPSKY
jgi:plastocyanin